MTSDFVIQRMEYSELDREIKRTLHRSAKDVVQLGFMLRQMMEKKIWAAAFDCFDAYLEKELHMDYSMANRFMNINRKYSVSGNSMEISAEYEGYSQGLLIEMLNMPPGLEAEVTPDMTVKQVREIKKQAKAEKKASAQPAAEKKETVIDGEYREIDCSVLEEENIATSQPQDKKNIRDKGWFVQQYVEIMPGEAARLFEICRRERNNTDRARAIQKHIAPYGCHITSCSEYDFAFHGFSGGMDFRIGNEKMHLKYGAFVVELMKLLEEEAATPESDMGVPEGNSAYGLPNPDTEDPDEESEEEYVPEDDLTAAKYVLKQEKKLLDDYLGVGGLPKMTVLKQKTIVAALSAMVCNLEAVESAPVSGKTTRPELPALKNNDQRKEWLADYKAWGLWYRDDNIDVNYYKYDFSDGSRLVVAEYPQRQCYWKKNKIEDEHFYHLLQVNKEGYRFNYNEKYRNNADAETSLVDFLKKLQKKK